MKVLAQVIIGIILIPLILLFFISVNLRFQLLSPRFWDNAFSGDNTYSKLSASISKNLTTQTLKEGGTAGDVKVLTDVLSTANLEDFLKKNISNFLSFANGKAKEAIVYIPISKVPKSLISPMIGSVSEQMKLTDLLADFNIHVTAAQIQMISSFGLGSWIIFYVIAVIAALLVFLIYLATDRGKHFITLGLTALVSGIISLVVFGASEIIRINWAKDLAGSLNLGDSLIGIIAPPIIGGLSRVWLWGGLLLLLIGITLFFIRKPAYNKPK